MGIKHKKPCITRNMDIGTDKVQVILKIPGTQNIAKVDEQSISSSKTEAITQEMIQDINREIPLYQDSIYRPPPRPRENLQLPKKESKAGTSPRIDMEFKENSLYQEWIESKAYQRPDKSYFQEMKEFRKSS